MNKVTTPVIGAVSSLYLFYTHLSLLISRRYIYHHLLNMEITLTHTISGSCCCGDVEFTLTDNFSNFFFCHCEQCRKLTGSAHASNLFTSPDNITWVNGADKVKRYDHPERAFSKVFCVNCASGLPYLSQSGESLIVPAGSLNAEPSIKLDAQIFCSEQTEWHKEGLQVAKVPSFPK